VLAGGLGTRLQSVTKGMIPKPMVEVQGRPFIHWLLNYLDHQKISHTILAVSHQSDQILRFLGDRFGNQKLKYSIEQTPLGTGGAILQAMDQYNLHQALVLNGDTYFPIDIQKMVTFHALTKADLTIAVKFLRNFDRYGSVRLNSNHQITAFREKEALQAGYINAGAYLLQRALFHEVDRAKAFSIEKDLFPQILRDQKVVGFKSRAPFIDIGIPEDYHKVQKMKLS
jgi:D-glycero-alpha-D-manno-heptose 1-phosphate guanylyltransferase